jgi:hypothetical protein
LVNRYAPLYFDVGARVASRHASRARSCSALSELNPWFSEEWIASLEKRIAKNESTAAVLGDIVKADQVAKVLASAPVQAAVTKSLLDFAKTKANTPNSTVVSGEEAKNLVESLQKSVSGAASDESASASKAEHKQAVTPIPKVGRPSEEPVYGLKAR